MAMSFYTSASIFGPLILIGGTGFLLDKHFGTEPVITIIFFFIAFIISNVLLFRKTMILASYIDKTKKDKQEEKNTTDQ